MRTVPATVAALLNAAWDLVQQRHFDAEVMLELLDNLPREYLGLQTRGAIVHARLTTSSALNGDPYDINAARSAMARVVELLERSIVRER